MKKKVAIVSVLIVVLCGAFFLKKGKGVKNSEQPEFVKVRRGDMVITLKESGFLNAVEEVMIKNEIAFSSVSILEVVPDGAFVKKGDVLVELDAAPLLDEKGEIENKVSDKKLSLTEAENTYEITESEIASSITTAKNAIEFARLDLEKFETLDKVRQLDEALQDIDIAEDELRLSEQGYEASVKLAEKGFETKSKVDSDKLALSARKRNLKSSRAKYKMLESYDLHKEGLQLTKKLEEAKSKYDRERKEGDNKIQKAKAKLENAKSSLVRAEEKLADIEDQLTKVIIKAPISGYALYPSVRYYQTDRKITKGKKVQRNESLIRIPNMESLKVDIDVAEHFVNDLEVGQKVVVTIDSLKDKNFSGELSHVALLPIKEASWNKSAVQKYKVVIDVSDTSLPDDIKPQISASTEIILDTLEGVISVPIQAVHTVKGKQTVYVKNGAGSGYEAREVKIGKMDTNYIHIVDGLKDTEKVLVSEPVL